MAANTPNFTDQGGATQHVGSGGAFTVDSGGVVTIQSGAAETVASGGALVIASGATETVAGTETVTGTLNVSTGTFQLGGTTVTATAAELNASHGVTAGTTAASSALVVDANKRLDALVVGTLSLGAGAGTAVTATAAELNELHSVTAGTAAASSALVLDANKAETGMLLALGTAATTTAAQPAGALTDATTTTSGTVQSTEYPLNNVTLPANAFSRTGSSVSIVAHGTLAANANAKTLKLYFGSTVVATVTGNTGNGVPFSIEALVYRTGASTQRYHAWLSVNGTYSEFDGTATETDTATILVKSASINTAAAAASGTGTGLLITFNT